MEYSTLECNQALECNQYPDINKKKAAETKDDTLQSRSGFS